jgi:hypothetical protein
MVDGDQRLPGGRSALVERRQAYLKSECRVYPLSGDFRAILF